MKTIKNASKNLGREIKSATGKIKITLSQSRFLKLSKVWLGYMLKVAVVQYVGSKVIITFIDNKNIKAIEWVVNGLTMMAKEIFAFEYQLDLGGALA